MLAILVPLTGCIDKTIAQWNNSSTEKAMAEARDMEAPKYATQQYSAASTALENSKKALQQGDNKNAKDQSATAKASAKDALNLAKSAKAAADFNLAEQKFRVAMENDGRQASPAKFAQIQKDLEEARKYNAKASKNFKQIIKFSDSVIEGVNSLLGEVIKQANQEVTQSRMTLDQAKQNEAETRAVGDWAKAKVSVEEAETLLKQEKYKNARTKAKEAQFLADAALQIAMESKCRDEMIAAERIMSALNEVQANKYTKGDFSLIDDNFQRATQAYKTKDYRIALDVFRIVQARGPEIVQRASQLQMRDQLKTASRDIDRLKINDAEKYAPAFLSEAEALLEEAKNAFDSKDYEKVKSLYADISDKIDRANEKLRVGADDQIQLSDIAIKDAIDAGATDFAKELLLRSQQLRATSINMMNQKQFRESIQMAKATVVKAQEAKTAAIKKKAELELAISENEIKRAVGDSAQLYATEEIQAAREILRQGREALLGGQYSKARDLAAETRAKVDESYTAMKKKAVNQIDEARKAIDNAADEHYMVNRYPQAAQTLNAARQKLNESNSLLNSNAFARTIEKAVETRATAVDSKNIAIRMQIADRTPVVRRQIDEARIAKAYTYSIEDYDSSLANLKLANDNLAIGKYDAALDALDNAEKNAETALKGQIIRARNQIETAKSLGGWKHETGKLQDAVIALDNAEKMMRSGSYDQSLAAANASLSAAGVAQQSTRDKIIFEEYNNIIKQLNSSKLVIAMIPEKVNDIKAKADSAVRNYKAEKGSQSAFEKSLNSLTRLKTNATTLDSDAKAQKESYSKQIEDGLVKARAYKAQEFASRELDGAEDYLRIAEASYKRGDYANAKLAYEQSLKSIKEIETRKAEKIYKDALLVQVKKLNKALGDFSEIIEISPTYWEKLKGSDAEETYKSLDKNFHNVVSLSPDFLKAAKGDLRTDPYKGIQGTMTAGKFRQVVTEINVRSKSLTPPPTMEGLHSKALKMFENAKLAGECFDKFGYNANYQPKTRDQFIEKGFQYIQVCWYYKQQVDTSLSFNKNIRPQGNSFAEWILRTKNNVPAGESFLSWISKK